MISLGVVGCGRVGSALARAINASPHLLLGVADRASEPAHRLANQVDTTVMAPVDLLHRADVTVIAVPDDTIASLADLLTHQLAHGLRGDDEGRARAVVHTSGASSPDALAPLAAAGWSIGSWHPLQAFPTLRTPLEPGITWAITAPEPLAVTLERVTLDLEGRPLALPADRKPLYHAAAVVAANYTVTLLAHAAALLGDCGLPQDEALAALLPLLRTTLAGLREAGLPDGLTGPLARADLGTISVHLRALRNHPDTAALYRAAGLATLPVLTQRGLDTSQVEAIRALLTAIDPDAGSGG